MVGEVARLLGKPFMPWQQYVADVALEIDPVTGLLAYNEFGLTVPRQSGKSTFILAKAVHRASATQFFGVRQRIVYTAQTRIKAREKWEEDYAADIKAAPAFRHKVSPHFGNGNEHLRFPNRSRFGIESNTEKAGHGGTLDEAYIDEAFAQVDGRLEQAFRPAMITRPNTQIGWVSTAGWSDGSPFLQAKVARGRALVESGVRKGLCYFEWSAPEDVDVEDRDAWWRCMPALGHTITEEAIAEELEAMRDNIADFRRAYLNQWVPKSSGDPAVIDATLWDGLRDLRPVPLVAASAFSLDVPPDRSGASISAVGFDRSELPRIELTEQRAGTEWAAARLKEIAATQPAARRPFYDKTGPVASMVPALKKAGLDPQPVSSTELMAACGLLYDLAHADGLRHLGDPRLSGALSVARKRVVGDAGAWHWCRRDTTSDISPLVAGTLALHGHSTASHRTFWGARA